MGNENLRAKRLLATVSALGMSLGVAFDASTAAPPPQDQPGAAGTVAADQGTAEPVESVASKQKAWLPRRGDQQTATDAEGNSRAVLGTHIKKVLRVRQSEAAPVGSVTQKGRESKIMKIGN